MVRHGPRSSPSHDELARAVGEALRRTEGGRQHSAAVTDAAGSMRVIDAFCLPHAEHDSATVYVVVVERVAQQRPCEEDLAREFGLTRREAEVARAMADRLSSSEIAESLGMSLNTARRHSERVLAKLGVRSRREINSVVARARQVIRKVESQ